MLRIAFAVGWMLLATELVLSTGPGILLSPLEDPFMDPYIETVCQMSVKEIMAIPKLNDTEFIHYLLDDTYGYFVPSARVDNQIFDPLRDSLLQGQPDVDQEWETLMVSGPIVVNYMGNLMVLASKKDFPFQVQPDYVFRYIRYPQSFRATLTQVSTDMYNALMGAHTAMNKIQLSIQQVPTHVKTTLKIITASSDSMLKTMLPRTLETISRLATESAVVANETLIRFNLLQELLGEIIELSATTQSANEADIDRMKEQKLNATLEQDRLEKRLQEIKQQYASSKQELEAARKSFNHAMHEAEQVMTPEIVVASKTKKGNILSQAIGLVTNPVKTIGCLIGGCGTVTYAVDNSKFENAMQLVLAAKEQLAKAEQLHNEQFQLLLAEQNELAKIMNQMALLDFSQLSTEEIVRLLLQATGHIHLIREQWSRMIQFFSKLATHADNTQKIVVKDFVEVIQAAQTDNLLVDPFDREFFLEILMPITEDIEKKSHLLFTMARTYYTISSEHMINQIAGIGKFMLLQTDDERTKHLQQASNTTLTTSMQITQLAQDRHEEYLVLTHQRQAEYATYMQSLTVTQLGELIG